MTMTVRGGLLAAASVFALAIAFTSATKAQEAAALSAELAARGAWNDSTTYVIDDIVTSRGSTWRSKRNSNLNKVPGQTQPSTATSWELFARGFNPLGAWSNATKYQPDDLVTHLGQTYRARITNLNKQPTNTTNWELLAAKGAAGPNTGIGAGSADAPSISFNGDDDTGIYQPDAGKIALVENGVRVLHNPGNNNTALGAGALTGSSLFGGYNVAVGSSALLNNQLGEGNVGIGGSALKANTNGIYNIAIGQGALQDNTAGQRNIAIGPYAGSFVTTGSNNIFIGNWGDGADDAVIRIGTQGTQTTAFMAGITGVTVANEAAVAIDASTGQLGIVTSSRRYKEDVAPMGDVNATLMKLRPVTFRYKSATDAAQRVLQYGLIAEEVAEAVPYLAALNAQGTPETVKYHLLPSFLLAGYQAQQHKIAEQTTLNNGQQQTIAAQADELARLKERVAATEALEQRLQRLEALLPQTRAASIQ